MAQPTGHQNVMLSAAQGMPNTGAPTLIPNGQPPQWNRPPPTPQTMKFRPPPTGSNIPPSVSNGTPTPPNYSHPGSLASTNSSRDPSPIPPNRPGENYSNSSPNLLMTNNQPLHPQTQMPVGVSRTSTAQHRVPQYNAQGLPQSLVNQNIGQSKSSGSLNPHASSPLLPVLHSGPSMSSNITSNTPNESGSQSSSQETSQNSTPENIPFLFVKPTHPSLRSGASQNNNQQNADSRSDPPSQDLTNNISNTSSTLPPVQSSGNTSQEEQIPPISRINAQGPLPNQQTPSLQGMSPRPQMGMNAFQQPGKQQPPGGQSTPQAGAMPPSRMPALQSGEAQKLVPNMGMPPSSSGYIQSVMPPTSGSHIHSPQSTLPASSTNLPPSSGGISHPGVPPSSSDISQSTGSGYTQMGTSQPRIPPNRGYTHPGMPPPGAGHTQPGMPPSGAENSQRGIQSIPPVSAGYSQPGMPPISAGFSQPGIPPINIGYSKPGVPPTSAGYPQPRVPPTSAGYSQPGMPSSAGYSQPGMPSSAGYSQPGLPPTSAGISQPKNPPTTAGYPQERMPPTSSGYSQPGMPPTSAGYSQPGMPPTSAGYSQPGKPPTGAGYSHPGMSPSNFGYSQPGMPPTSAAGYSQTGVPPNAGYPKPGVPPSSAGYSEPGKISTNVGPPPPGMPPTNTGMPPTSGGYAQPGVSPTGGGFGQPGMPPANKGYPQPSLPNQFSMPPQPGSASQDGSQHLGKRYPPQQPSYSQQRSQASGDALAQQMGGLSVTQMGFNKIWGMESVDLLQNRNILPPEKVEPPKVRLHQEFLDSVNCSPEIFRCTLTKIPETNSLLQKSRLPLGILIHPFKDLNHLPVIQCSTIVRCRSCRTYINPFVYFVDHKRWKCNLCFRVNELPEEFQYDPVSKTYGDPTRRPEVKSSTIEFIAPSEYMLRPPQPAVYLFLLDVSRLGVDCGYLRLFCDILLEELDKLPGDGRTQVGFITYDSCVHFYNLAENLSQPQQMIVVDIDDVFLPCPDNLLVNLSESRELVKELLNQIPTKFLNSHDTNSSLGAALQVAYKLMAPTGGRVTVFQTCLPNHGPGMLTVREDPSQRAGKEAPHLNPATDFYKRLALDCSGQQIAVDLFLINSQYSDLATLSGISRFSGGCIFHFPLFNASNIIMADSLERSFRRYLTRKIGFEAVMRIRCSRGLAIHTFHGNFFVRSTDLLSLPNVNPDAGFGMQMSIEESLSDVQNVCFQAALLYTSSKGERRIRVHTLCLPVAANLSDILYSADQQCIVGLLSKMAVDRSHQSSLSDARDAFINVAIDVLSAYKLVQSNPSSSSLLAPSNLRLLPLYILALLKYVAFRTGQSTRLDDRLFAMCQMKSLPLTNLIQAIYPDMYPVHYLTDQSIPEIDIDGTVIPQPPRLHLSAEKLDSHGAFLMDTGDLMMMYVGHNISCEFCSSVLGVPAFSHIPEEMFELPENESPESERLRTFVNHLQSEKPYHTMFQVIRDDSHFRAKFIERLIEDRSESALSYYEFLQHLKTNVK